AASQPETLEEVVLRYRQAARAAGAELDDCIITKQDEAGRLAPVLDIVMRHGMRVLFGSYGQQVPEDMVVATPPALIDQALSANVSSSARAETAPLSLPRWSRDVLGQGRRLSSVLTRLRQRVVDFHRLEAAWDIAALPGVIQDQRLDELLAGASTTRDALGVVWSPRRNERGCDWSMPDVALNEQGAWLALTRLQHRQLAGWQPRLVRCAGDVAVHLLPTLPDAEALAWLNAQHLTWVSMVPASQRVYCQGERYTLRSLFQESTLTHSVGIRFRGQSMQLSSAYVEAQDVSGNPVLAWVGEVSDPESTKRIVRRYWLTPARLGSDVLTLLITQLQSDGLASLTKRAWQQLKEADGGDVSSELRLLMASGAAAVAGHLDIVDDEDAQALRADLLRLLGTQRKRRDTALLDALVHVLMARDAIRQLGSVSREGVV
ncbi:MAG TPA: flagellar biosynthesis protein FlhF, partial [Halomonas sp.]|nr:flagellar biosynthesis protein FlhF [Pseudomonadota bacterium]MEC9306598.1 flagellar biosynthesis protein FlhF [Pseudomonadota bacterium]MED5252711.1 flagellar biosynthesis protein FlhF [Pseudomonadota bacterium]HAY15645.1 flagellar biosynthesis protein FlhF [Halomonas sp.]HBM44806.1 flagellar biosynthesis protein FlhF [Halomonas sp.]